jgi:hypothetical protein
LLLLPLKLAELDWLLLPLELGELRRLRVPLLLPLEHTLALEL